MITQKVTSIIKNLTKIVNQFNILLKSCEKLFRGIFYILSLIYIAKGTLHQTITQPKIMNYKQIVPEGELVKKVELVKYTDSPYEYIVFIIGVLLMLIVLYKFIKLFKNNSV